jgi:hypothetical protein
VGFVGLALQEVVAAELGVRLGQRGGGRRPF